MGKKKRPAGPAQIPLFYAKKRKLNEATQLTALVALHKYCAKFKLGAPGFRPLTTAPHHEVCVVMDGAELGRARHADRAGAMERAALLTLNLLDPEAKSLPANVAWPDAAAVRALQLAVIGAKHDAPAPPAARRPPPPPAAPAPAAPAPRAALPPAAAAAAAAAAPRPLTRRRLGAPLGRRGAERRGAPRGPRAALDRYAPLSLPHITYHAPCSHDSDARSRRSHDPPVLPQLFA